MSSLKQFVRTWVAPPGFLSLWVSAKYRLNQLVWRREDIQLLAQNKALKDRHAGSRCFILGAGSSIAQQDLNKLAGEYVISVSNTFVHPEYSSIRPRYHVLPAILLGHDKYYPKEKFIDWLKDMESRTLDAEMFFHIGDREMIESNGLFRGRTLHWIEYAPWAGSVNTPIDLSKVPTIWSVSELAITTAIYLGFKEIYLIGMDHDWFNGPLVYFYDANKDHKMHPTEKLLQQHGVDAEFQMRRHADIFRKYKYLYGLKQNIFNANANPNHYLDVFPKVEYESLFSDCDGYMGNKSIPLK